MKMLTYAVGGVVVVAAAIIIVLVFFSGDVIRTAVLEIGPKLTKSEVRLGEVDLSLSKGEASLKQLKIGNPKGFNTDHAFRLGSIKVKLDTSTLTSDTIVINEINVQSPSVIAEFEKFAFNPLDAKGSIQKSMETSNFAAIQHNVEEYTGKSSGGGGGGAKSEGPKLIIEKLRMTDIHVRAVSQSGLALDTEIPPFDISLDNIGKKEGGLKPDQIAAVLIPEVQSAITNGMVGPLIKTATSLVGKVGDAAKEGIKAVTEGAGSAGSAVGDAAKGVGSAVGGALKGLMGK